MAAELKKTGRPGNRPYSSLIAIRRNGDLFIRNGSAWMNDGEDSKGAATMRKLKEMSFYTISKASWTKSDYGYGGDMLEF